MSELHCGVPVPDGDPPSEEWTAFHAQVERNLAWVEAIRLGMRVEDVEREQRGLLARLRAGDEVELKVIPPQPGFYWLRVRLHLRGQPAGWNPPEVGQLRVGIDGECKWDVCGSEQGLNDGEFEVLSERLAFGGGS